MDSRLSISYPFYDPGSRPGSEVVGAHSPIPWQYDVYSRAEKVILPEGPGRLGTVLGILAEEESQDPAKPTLPVRYTYTPYGEAHAETGPEFRSARFDVGKLMVGGIEQLPATPITAAGSLRLSFSVPLDPATVGEGLKLEELTSSGWQTVAPTELMTSFEEGEGLDLWVGLRPAWKRETKYRAHVGQGLKDRTGRPLTTERQVEFSFATGAAISISPADRRYPFVFGLISRKKHISIKTLGLGRISASRGDIWLRYGFSKEDTHPMKRMNFSIHEEIYIRTDSHLLDFHANYSFVGFSFETKTRHLYLEWHRDEGDLAAGEPFEFVQIHFKGVSFLAMKPRAPEMPFTEDTCLSFMGYLHPDDWPEMCGFLLEEEADESFHMIFSFQNGASIKVFAEEAMVLATPQ